MSPIHKAINYTAEIEKSEVFTRGLKTQLEASTKLSEDIKNNEAVTHEKIDKFFHLVRDLHSRPIPESEVSQNILDALTKLNTTLTEVQTNVTSVQDSQNVISTKIDDLDTSVDSQGEITVKNMGSIQALQQIAEMQHLSIETLANNFDELLDTVSTLNSTVTLLKEVDTSNSTAAVDISNSIDTSLKASSLRNCSEISLKFRDKVTDYEKASGAYDISCDSKKGCYIIQAEEGEEGEEGEEAADTITIDSYEACIQHLSGVTDLCPELAA